MKILDSQKPAQLHIWEQAANLAEAWKKAAKEAETKTEDKIDNDEGDVKEEQKEDVDMERTKEETDIERDKRLRELLAQQMAIIHPPLARDGRDRLQLRPIHMETKVIGDASGSAIVQFGNTQVIVSVWGPNQSRESGYSDACSLMCDFKYAPFALAKREKRGRRTVEQQMSRILEQTLGESIIKEQYPKAVIECYINVVECDGSALPIAMTAVALALADAGIEMYDVVIGLKAICDENDKLYLDPTLEEEKHPNLSASVALGYMPKKDIVNYMDMEGSLTEAMLERTIHALTDGSIKVREMVSKCLIASCKKAQSQER